MDIQSLRQSERGQAAQRIQALRSERIIKLQEQAKLAKQVQGVVGVYQRSSKSVIKSVEAAVSVSRQPGVIDYATHKDGADNVSDLEEVLKLLDASYAEIADLDGRIAKAEKEFREAAAAAVAQAATSDGDAQPGSLREWLEQNGRPKGKVKGMMSELKPSRKRVNHHMIDDSGNPTEDHRQKKSLGVKLVRGKLVD